MSTDLHPAFGRNFYLFRRKVLKIFGGAFHVYSESGDLLFFSKQKAFKLREDLRVYSDETMAHELLTINTPQILDFGATYYVKDATTGQTVGAVARKGLKSLFKDEWKFLNQAGMEIGRLTEKSALSALSSRILNLIPQKYVIQSSDGREVAQIQQRFNPFVLKYGMRVTAPEPPIDRRLLIAAGIMLAAIEGRQIDYG